MKTLKRIISICGYVLSIVILVIGWKYYLVTGHGYTGTADAIYHVGLVISLVLAFAPDLIEL